MSWSARSLMKEALREAELAFEAGEVPVGAVLECDGEIIARAHNQVETLLDASAHAELLVIQEACRKLNRKWLSDCRLVVTLEPCAMCAGAIAAARIGKLYYGAYDTKSGGTDHGARVFDHPQCHWKPEVTSGIEEKHASALLKQFFSQSR